MIQVVQQLGLEKPDVLLVEEGHHIILDLVPQRMLSADGEEGRLALVHELAHVPFTVVLLHLLQHVPRVGLAHMF